MEVPVEAEDASLRLLDQHTKAILKILYRLLRIVGLERQAAEIDREATLGDLEGCALIARVILPQPCVERLVASVDGVDAIDLHACELLDAKQLSRDVAEVLRVEVAGLPSLPRQ